jgi:YVTN family beta-propeller protein
VTNKIYVGGFDGTVTVIDGVTNSATTLAVGSGSYFLAVNPLTNKIYVGNYYDNTVGVIDGASNQVTTLPVGTAPYSVAVNPATNKIYFADAESANVTVIDGATNSSVMVATGSFPCSVAVNPVTSKIYVANKGDLFNPSIVTVIDEREVEPSPLTTSITPLPGNQTNRLAPNFTFAALSTTMSKPDDVFFQADTWQNPWITASGSDPSFDGTLSALQPGFHILYAYATDGQEATSTQADSPFSGAVQAYGFLVVPLPPVAVTVGTDVAGALFVVDGQSYTSPETFQFAIGSSHTIATTSPQNGRAGKAFVFTQWSDGDTSISRTVTAPSTAVSYTAYFRVLLSQTIAFAALPNQQAGTSLTLNASATSGLPVSFSSATSSVCTVSKSSTTFIAAGTCTIRASQSGNATYAPAQPVFQSFSVF